MRSLLLLTVANLAFGAEVRASLMTVAAPSAFVPGTPVITFETGSTNLPTVPGVSFLGTEPGNAPWFSGVADFPGLIGVQSWSNLVSAGDYPYSELGLTLATPVEAIGGYVGKPPHNLNSSDATQVTFELFDSSGNSLGTDTISLPSQGKDVWFGFTASEPIATFTASGNDTGFFMIDNFTYGSVFPTPEPSTWVQLVTAFGVLCGWQLIRLRKRTALAALSKPDG